MLNQFPTPLKTYEKWGSPVFSPLTSKQDKKGASMTNLEKIKLEFNNKEYLSDIHFSALLQENELSPEVEYDYTKNKLSMLCCVRDVLEIFSNDIDSYRKIATDFSTIEEATQGLTNRLMTVEKKIKELSLQQNQSTNSQFSIMFHS